jgi:hypothetical protein
MLYVSHESHSQFMTSVAESVPHRVMQDQSRTPFVSQLIARLGRMLYNHNQDSRDLPNRAFAASACALALPPFSHLEYLLKHVEGALVRIGYFLA